MISLIFRLNPETLEEVVKHFKLFKVSVPVDKEEQQKFDALQAGKQSHLSIYLFDIIYLSIYLSIIYLSIYLTESRFSVDKDENKNLMPYKLVSKAINLSDIYISFNLSI